MTDIIRIPNIENFTQEIIDGVLILTPKENFISEDEFNRIIFNSSKISECVVKYGDDLISNKTKYLSILKDIWKTMPTQKILQTTNFNMKLTEQHGIDGYIWCKDLKLSIQYRDAKYTMKEIINMIKVNNYSIIISIVLETGQLIKYKYNL